MGQHAYPRDPSKSDPFDPLTHDPSTNCLLWLLCVQLLLMLRCKSIARLKQVSLMRWINYFYSRMFIPLRSVNIPHIKKKKWNSRQLLKRKARAILSCMLRITVHATETFLESSENCNEVWAVPVPGAVDDKVSRVDDEWSVMCVELARLVRRTSPIPA